MVLSDSFSAGLVKRRSAAVSLGHSSVTSRQDAKYIEWVQRELNRLLGTKLAVNGRRDAATTRATRLFQSKHELKPDGVVGPAAEHALVKQGASPPPGMPSEAEAASLRGRVVAVTMRELARWGDGKLHETAPKASAHLARYYSSIRQKPTTEQLRSKRYHDGHPWSARFVSWVFREAGAGVAFRYAAAHTVYVSAAKEERERNSHNPIKAYSAPEVIPRPGDVVVRWREAPFTFDEVHRQLSHGDIVVSVGENYADVVGGNVNDSIRRRRLELDEQGRVADPKAIAIVCVGAPMRRRIGACPLAPRPSSEARSRMSRSSGSTPASSGTLSQQAAPLGGAKVPPGFRPRGKGLARRSSARVDQTCLRLRAAGVVEVTDREIDIFQRVSEIETSGAVQTLNTWDSAVVSIGFFQWTLQHGKVQRWIARAPGAFARHGISLDPSKVYSWPRSTGTAIAGVRDKDALRWNGWAQRFYLAGLDDEAIAAEIQLGREYVEQQLRSLRIRMRKNGVADTAWHRFLQEYERSPAVRGIVHATHNNRPAHSARAVQRALMSQARAAAKQSFLLYLQGAVRSVFPGAKGVRLSTKPLRGARLRR